jgi:hypothetical protein
LGNGERLQKQSFRIISDFGKKFHKLYQEFPNYAKSFPNYANPLNEAANRSNFFFGLSVHRSKQRFLRLPADGATAKQRPA